MEGVCVAAEDQKDGSLETAPAHDSPTENIWFALLAVNSFMCVLPRNFLPARTNTRIIIYSVLSSQEPCFAPHFFQLNVSPGPLSLSPHYSTEVRGMPAHVNTAVD